MIYKIEKDKIKDFYCEKCKQFLFSVEKDGWLNFPARMKVRSNGTEFEINCVRCKEKHIIKIDN